MNKKNRGNSFKMLLQQPILSLCILMIFVLLIVFILFPLVNVFRLAFTSNEGSFDLSNFISIALNSNYQYTFLNSIKLGLVVAVVAAAVGYLFAFSVTRTEMPGKKFFRMMATFPIITPPFVLSLSFIFLFGRQGLITKGLFGITTANIYGMHSLIAVQAISFFPVAFLTLTGILESIDDSVEDAAYNMGASRWHIFRTVTLPLSFPGIISAMLLVFIQSMEDFSNPVILAGSYSTLAVDAYRLVTGMFDMRGGAILAIILLMPTLLAFTLQKYWINKKSFVTVTGKPTQKRRKLDEPHIIWPLFALCALISAFLILLYGIVLIGAFVNVWGVDFAFTLDHFKQISIMGWAPLQNSVTIAVISAPITGIFGILIAYLTIRQKFIGRRFMEFSSILTFAIPGTVLGIGYTFTFNYPPLMLTGTALILVIAFVFRNIPVSIESGQTTLLQIDPSIESASAILGADSGTTFRRITLPLLRQPFYSGLVYAFVRAMTAVSSVIFLISPKWNLATARILSLFESSQYSNAAAFILVMMGAILIAIVVISIVVNIFLTPGYIKQAGRMEKNARKINQASAKRR